MAQRLKRPPPMRETQVPSLGREDPLEKGMVTHSSTLAWKIPWTEEADGLRSIGHKKSDTTEHACTQLLYDQTSWSVKSCGLLEVLLQTKLVEVMKFQLIFFFNSKRYCC